MKGFAIILAGAFLGLGVAAAGYFGSQTLVNGRTAVNTATVKGLAEREVAADRANWTVSFEAVTRTTEAPATEPLFAEAARKRDAILNELQVVGFAAGEVAATPLRYWSQDNTDFEGRYSDTSYHVSGTVRLDTDKLDDATAAFFAVSELPRKGVAITVDPPQYLFTSLNDIKPDMLRDATSNARIAAEEFARDAGVTVGGIQFAQQGGFTVRDLGSDFTETEARDKMVRVVTTITFYLEN